MFLASLRRYRLRRLPVFRAYLSPEKPRLKANLRVLLGFVRVFWKRVWKRRELNSICSGMRSNERY
jgi:hypothetical protein